MKLEHQLSTAEFAEVIRHAPLVSIDLIVRNNQGQVLLGKRNNAPAKGFWFVPGGRISKDEQLADAVARVLLEELGIHAGDPTVSFLGVYDHIYEDNVFGDPAYGTHYVVLAHQLELDSLPEELPAEQHIEYQWWAIEQLVHSSEVHSYTKAYFR